MPSWSQTDTLPFRRHDPSVQVRTFQFEGHKTTPLWSERSPFPDWEAAEPIPIPAPEVSVSLFGDTDLFNALVSRHQQVQEAHSRFLRQKPNRPSAWFMGVPYTITPLKPQREFLFR